MLDSVVRGRRSSEPDAGDGLAVVLLSAIGCSAVLGASLLPTAAAKEQTTQSLVIPTLCAASQGRAL